MLPQPLIEEYWDRLRRILQDDYHLSRIQSEQAVSVYRAQVEPLAGEMTYHQNIKEVAEAISHSVKR